MTRNRDVEQGLQGLLKDRRIPVDDERLEAMRQGLLRKVPVQAPRPGPGFFRQHRFSLSFGSALVLLGLIVWQFTPVRQDGPSLPGASKLMEIAADESRVDRALVLLGGFASSSAQGESIIDWEFYNRSMLGDYEDVNVLETFYGSI